MILYRKETPEWIHMSNIAMNGNIMHDVTEMQRVRMKVESCREEEEENIAGVMEGGNKCIMFLGCCGY